MSQLDTFIAGAKGAEGWSSTAYIDTRGYLTIGWGFNLGKIEVVDGKVRFTPVSGISLTVGEQLLLGKVLETVTALQREMPFFVGLDEVRQEVLFDLSFNMGWAKVLTFKIFLNQVRLGQYEAAAQNMEGWSWYKQVGRRSPRLVAMMRDGKPRPPLKIKRAMKLYYLIKERTAPKCRTKQKRGTK